MTPKAFRKKEFLKTPRHRKDIYQRIFISYPISKNLQKGYFLSFFGVGYFGDIISYVRDFKISYPYPILYPFFNVQCPRFWVSEARFFL
jgi:hypothetical protein